MNEAARHLLAMDAAVARAAWGARAGEPLEVAGSAAGKAFAEAGGIWMGGLHAIRAFETDFPHHDASGEAMSAYFVAFGMELHTGSMTFDELSIYSRRWMDAFTQAWPRFA